VAPVQSLGRCFLDSLARVSGHCPTGRTRSKRRLDCTFLGPRLPQRASVVAERHQWGSLYVLRFCVQAAQFGPADVAGHSIVRHGVAAPRAVSGRISGGPYCLVNCQLLRPSSSSCLLVRRAVNPGQREGDPRRDLGIFRPELSVRGLLAGDQLPGPDVRDRLAVVSAEVHEPITVLAAADGRSSSMGQPIPEPRALAWGVRRTVADCGNHPSPQGSAAPRRQCSNN
jgi:hypothetical protein